MFSDEFQILADGCRLTSAEMVWQVCNYVAPSICSLWEVLEGYQDANYRILKKEILDCYPKVRETRRYTLQDLKQLVYNCALQLLRSENDLADYYHTFKVVSQGLCAQGGLSANKVSLHDAAHKRIEQRLEILKPDHNNSKPWGMEEVFTVEKK